MLNGSCVRDTISAQFIKTMRKEIEKQKIGKKIHDKLCVCVTNREKTMNIEYTFTINNDKSQIIRQLKKKTGRQRARKVVY